LFYVHDASSKEAQTARKHSFEWMRNRACADAGQPLMFFWLRP
jgi:hypothetical protein